MTEQLPIPDLQNGHQQQFADVEDFLALFNTKMQAANRSWLVIHRISVFLFCVFFWGMRFKLTVNCWIHFWLGQHSFFFEMHFFEHVFSTFVSTKVRVISTAFIVKL